MSPPGPACSGSPGERSAAHARPWKKALCCLSAQHLVMYASVAGTSTYCAASLVRLLHAIVVSSTSSLSHFALELHRGTWYNILDWAARSTNCNNAPDSVACMACSQSLPAYSKAAGVAPLGRLSCQYTVPMCQTLLQSRASCSM